MPPRRAAKLRIARLTKLRRRKIKLAQSRRMKRLHKIQLLNDNHRQMMLTVFMSRPFYELPQSTKSEAFKRIQAYSKFAPNGQHDAGVIIMAKQSILWRIEYRAPDMKARSRDPADPNRTIRVLIVEVSERN